MTCKIFSEEQLSPAGQKNQQNIGTKVFYSSISYGLEYEKKYIRKLRKTKRVKVYAYRMLLKFETSVIYKSFFNFTPDNCVRCEAAFIGHNSIFCRTLHCVLVLKFRLDYWVWNRCPRICLIAKFVEKITMPKFETKSILFGYFEFGFFKKTLSYLKSAPLNLSKINF